MEGSAAESCAALERDAAAASNGEEPGVAVCRDGKIVWASRGLAERLDRTTALPLTGQSLESVLAEWGEPVGVTDAAEAAEAAIWRARGRDTGDERILRLEWLDLPAEVGDDVGPATRLCLVSDASLEGQLRERARALDRRCDELESRSKEIRQDRDELIALLSHELRTPLTVISGYSKLLLSERAGPLSDEQRRYLEVSGQSCERLNAFVVDLLDASHDHAGAICLRLEKLPIERSIRSVIEFFSPLFDEKGLGVEVEICEDLPIACYDPARIEQVLTNVLGNAVKYTKPGGAIRVEVSTASDSSASMIEVAITDDGPGIAPEDAERIFEPYVRGSGARPEGGVGLGLAICRRILDAHRGKIRVEAAPGGGSRFCFSVPARVAGSRVEC